MILTELQVRQLQARIARKGIGTPDNGVFRRIFEECVQAAAFLGHLHGIRRAALILEEQGADEPIARIQREAQGGVLEFRPAPPEDETLVPVVKKKRGGARNPWGRKGKPKDGLPA